VSLNRLSQLHLVGVGAGDVGEGEGLGVVEGGEGVGAGEGAGLGGGGGGAGAGGGGAGAGVGVGEGAGKRILHFSGVGVVCGDWRLLARLSAGQGSKPRRRHVPPDDRQ
jgi:hypothetical protein